jgi:hypothetical protein
VGNRRQAVRIGGGKGSGGNDKDAVKACVAAMEKAGWPVMKGDAFTERGTFDPLTNVSSKPTLIQLSEVHCVTTIEDEDGKWIYYANEPFALPLTREILGRCMGSDWPFEGYAMRAYRFTPGERARKATKRARVAESQ